MAQLKIPKADDIKIVTFDALADLINWFHTNGKLVY